MFKNKLRKKQVRYKIFKFLAEDFNILTSQWKSEIFSTTKRIKSATDEKVQ